MYGDNLENCKDIETEKDYERYLRKSESEESED
jgi:hypothetical protein